MPFAWGLIMNVKPSDIIFFRFIFRSKQPSFWSRPRYEQAAWSKMILWFIYMRICVEWSTSMSIDDDDDDNVHNDHADLFFIVYILLCCLFVFFFKSFWLIFVCAETNSPIPRNLNVISSSQKQKKNKRNSESKTWINWAIGNTSMWFTLSKCSKLEATDASLSTKLTVSRAKAVVIKRSACLNKSNRHMKIVMYQTHAKKKKTAVYVSALKNYIDIIILATLTYFRNNLLSLRVKRTK